MRLLNFQNLYFKRMASRMGLQDILFYIYIYRERERERERSHVRKYKILLNDAFYLKKIEIFSDITLEIKSKVNIDFLFHLVQYFKTFLIKK